MTTVCSGLQGRLRAAALTIALAVSLPTSGEGPGSVALPTSAALQDQDWYQIEIVLFAQATPPQQDELWPLRSHIYPRGTISLDPLAGEIMPPSLHLLPFVTASADGVAADDKPVFLFENKSRYRRQTGSGTMVPRQQQTQQLAHLFKQTPDDRPAFARLPRDMLLLAPIASRIRRSSRYRLLDHMGWQQPVVTGTNPAVLTQAGDYYGDQRELDGTIHITRSRYLHLHTDLWWSVFSQDDSTLSPGQRALIETYADRFPALANGIERSGYIPAAQYALQQSRRMRSGETHYIDHPYFGLVVLITPIEDLEEPALSQLR